MTENRAVCLLVVARHHDEAGRQSAMGNGNARERGSRDSRRDAWHHLVRHAGRGGEEALALHAAGVAYEVVPGVTTAVAAPALAGIPVTHRGLATGFVVVSGHDESAYGPVLGHLPPRAATVVVLMGLARRAAIARLLLDRAWSPATPAAVLYAAGTPEAHTWIGDLSGIGAHQPPAGDLPATIVIGDVVTLAAELDASPRRRGRAGRSRAGAARRAIEVINVSSGRSTHARTRAALVRE